jgi:hypothetical protein
MHNSEVAAQWRIDVFAVQQINQPNRRCTRRLPFVIVLFCRFA